MSIQRQFADVLRLVQNWNGADVRDLLPVLDKIEKIEESLAEEAPDFYVDLELAIEKSSVEKFWPEGLAEHIDFVAIDPSGNYIFREQKGPYLLGCFEFKDFSAQKLGDEVRTFCYRYGTAAAAQKLGLPRRTLEGICQDRGFRYPDLLRLGMRCVNSNK